jgi:hypothetical protein
MTSPSFVTSGTEEHPEVAEISALTEGLLTPERSADVQTHLSGCALCADVRNSLGTIRNALGTLPAPPRMPDDIAGRIDAALAAEALLNAAAAEPTSAEPTSDVSRETRATPRGDAVRGTARKKTRPPGRRQFTRKRHRRRTALLSASGAIAALALGALVVPGLLSSGSDSGSGPQAGAGQETFTGQPREDAENSLTVTGLEEQVHTLLAKTTAANETTGKAEGAPDNGVQSSPTAPFTIQNAESVPLCVQEGTNRGEPPLAASEETYEGSAAYLLVLPNSDDEQRVDAYVVDASCVTQSPGDPGKLLASRTFERR